MRVHGGGIYNLIWVEDAVGIEGGLHLPHQLVAALAHHNGDELAAQAAIAVLAAQRTAVLLYQMGHIGGDGLKQGHILFVL